MSRTRMQRNSFRGSDATVCLFPNTFSSCDHFAGTSELISQHPLQVRPRFHVPPAGLKPVQCQCICHACQGRGYGHDTISHGGQPSAAQETGKKHYIYHHHRPRIYARRDVKCVYCVGPVCVMCVWPGCVFVAHSVARVLCCVKIGAQLETRVYKSRPPL